MKNSKFYNQIKSYLDGELSPADLEAFQEKMKKDAQFAEEVKLFQISREKLLPLLQKKKEIANFRTLIEQKSKDYFPEETANTGGTEDESPSSRPSPKVVKFWTRRRKQIAGAVAASLLLLVLWKPAQDWLNPPSLMTLYEDLHEVPSSSFTTLSVAILEEQIDRAIENKEYEKALDLLNQYIAAGEGNQLEAQFFKGICLQKLGQHTQAITTFKLLSEGDSILKNDAHWYLALSYLYKEDLTTCRKYLNQIEQNSGKYEAAQTLLRRLERH